MARYSLFVLKVPFNTNQPNVTMNSYGYRVGNVPAKIFAYGLILARSASSYFWVWYGIVEFSV